MKLLVKIAAVAALIGFVAGCSSLRFPTPAEQSTYPSSVQGD